MSAAMDNWMRRHRLTVEEYHRMSEVGLLAPDARVELIEGEIIDMARPGPRHCAVVDRLNRLFIFAVGDFAIVRSQGPVLLSRWSEPQPDLLLLQPESDFYMHAHPTGVNVFLAVEVSDSTLKYDQEIKAPLYARHDIPEFWLVDIQRATLNIFSRPERGRYAEHLAITELGIVPISGLQGVQVDLTGIFGS